MLELPPQPSVHQEIIVDQKSQYPSPLFAVDSPDLKNTEDKITKDAESIKAIFADGIQWRDIPEFIVHVNKLLDGTSADQKRALGMRIIDRVIDLTDTPYLPDPLTDPLFKVLAHSLMNFTFDLLDNTKSFSALLPSNSPVTTHIPAQENLTHFVYQIKDLFKDGVQWSDLVQIIFLSVNFIDEFSGLDELEKRAAVISILDEVIDVTNTPYLPDRVFDPMFKQMVPSFVDYVMAIKKV
jgi:hypothetical protein